MNLFFKNWFCEWTPPVQEFLFKPTKTQLSNEIKLYHATPYMEEIENFGLKTKAETGISTFGSAGAKDENTISVTPFYENAYGYAKALKLLALASQGKITIEKLPSIIRMYKPNIYYYELKNTSVDDIFVDHGHQRYEAYEMSNKLLNYLKNSTEELPSLTYDEEIEIVTIMIHSLGSYTANRFPWIIMQKGYKNQINLYKSFKLDSIGVVELRLKEPIKLDYLHGEKEFRIPPDKLQVYGFRNIDKV